MIVVSLRPFRGAFGKVTLADEVFGRDIRQVAHNQSVVVVREATADEWAAYWRGEGVEITDAMLRRARHEFFYEVQID